jgi:hypothetical protein
LCGVYNPLAENISSRDCEYRHNNFFCNFFHAWLKLKIYGRHAKSHFLLIEDHVSGWNLYISITIDWRRRLRRIEESSFFNICIFSFNSPTFMLMAAPNLLQDFASIHVGELKFSLI